VSGFSVEDPRTHLTSSFSLNPDILSEVATLIAGLFGSYPGNISPNIPDDYSGEKTESLSSSLASFNISSSSSSEPGSDDDEKIECMGISIEWKPGSIWNTYPYHQHAERSMAWEPIAIENNGSLRLRSRKCPIWFIPSHLSHLTCSFCCYIPNSVEFRKFMTHAVEAPVHTPWAYLNYQQLHG
jgi:hypothetical protein